MGVKDEDGKIGVLKPQSKGNPKKLEGKPGEMGCYSRPGEEVFEASCNAFPKDTCLEYDNCYWGTPEEKAMGEVEPMQPMGFEVSAGTSHGQEPKVDVQASMNGISAQTPEEVAWDAEWEAREKKRKSKRERKR